MKSQGDSQAPVNMSTKSLLSVVSQPFHLRDIGLLSTDIELFLLGKTRSQGYSFYRRPIFYLPRPGAVIMSTCHPM